MRRFVSLLFLITLLSHLPFAAALTFALSRAGVGHAAWVALGITCVPVAMLRGRVARLRVDRPMSWWRLALIEEPWYAHWCATILAWPLLALSSLTALGAHALGAAHSSSTKLGVAACAAYALALVITSYGVMVRRRWVRVRSIDVALRGLPPRFDGYRIAHLSDLHIGGLWPRARAARWARRVNALDADLVALTGDYVTHGDSFHEDVAQVISSMRARDGAVAVLGNHDYFGDGDALARVLAQRGVTVLRNERCTIARGDEAITIAGVDDSWSGRASTARALEGAPTRGTLIALTHDPQLFPELAARGAALTLGGHTHWGQLAVPFLAARLNLSRLTYHHHAGWYRRGDAVLYVSPGLGTTGPPLRIGAPPEITILCLRRSEGE